jgi:hypothetical protein
MASQVSAGGIADAEFANESRIAQSALFQIPHSFRMTVEL